MKRDRKQVYELLQNVARNLTALSAAISEIVDLETRKTKQEESSTASEPEEEEKPPKKRQKSAEKEEDIENDMAQIFDKEELDAIESSLGDQEWNHFDEFVHHIQQNKIVSSSHQKERIRRVAQVFYGIWDYERQQALKRKSKSKPFSDQSKSSGAQTPGKIQSQTPGREKQKNKPNGAQ